MTANERKVLQEIGRAGSIGFNPLSERLDATSGMALWRLEDMLEDLIVADLVKMFGLHYGLTDKGRKGIER